MLQTTLDMYRAFLDGIKKNSTAIVTPDQFNRIINHWGQDEYILDMFPEGEQDIVGLDDMEILRVVTDGIQVVEGVTLFPVAPDASNNNVFTIPKHATTVRRRLADGTIDTNTYPKYARGLNVMFKIKYGAGSTCHTKDSISDDFIRAYIMRTDQRSVIMTSLYRKPTDSLLYYEMIDGKIRLIAGNGAEGYSLRMEYYRYPVEIFFNSTAPADTGNKATGSVNCEFAPHQRKEIVDIAVRIYLERVSDPRYKSFINEENIRASNQ